MWSTIWSARALMPLLFLGGFLMAYQFGVFPLVMRRADVGLCFVIFGIAEVLGAWLCGRWVGSLGASRYRLLTMIVTTLSLILALPIALTAPHPQSTNQTAPSSDDPSSQQEEQLRSLERPLTMLLPSLAAAFFGLSDSAIAVLAYTDLGQRARVSHFPRAAELPHAQGSDATAAVQPSAFCLALASDRKGSFRRSRSWRSWRVCSSPRGSCARGKVRNAAASRCRSLSCGV